MQLDYATIYVMAVTFCVPLAIVLFVAWRGNRAEPALAWWSGTFAVTIVGLSLLGLRGLIPDLITIDFANALVLLGAAFGLVGARAFNGRTTPILLIFLPPGLWAFACRIPEFYDSMSWRVAGYSLIHSAVAAAIAIEFWRGRADRLKSRYMLVGACLLLSAFYASRIVFAYLMPMGEPRQYSDTSIWFALTILGPTIVGAMIAILVVTIAKERVEAEQRYLAEIDPLTLVPNRGATLTRARASIAAPKCRSAAVLLFDLDHFKQINDRYGHPAGDEVLRTFAMVAAGQLREEDIFGRIGGEEFLALLTNADQDGAIAAAERIRAAFSVIRIEGSSARIPATVSIGIAVADETGLDIDLLLGTADKALYRAKESGRNQVHAVRSAAA
ncbi:GGDEF domain-containing protein [Microbaculum marinum]|uniref:diguanylate cyclase n=1 Tax=Microbaculum marinum TaxID=1764581 RepID=A0AAW9S0J6_9HYPH